MEKKGKGGGGARGGGDRGIVPQEILSLRQLGQTEDMKVTGKTAGWLPSR